MATALFIAATNINAFKLVALNSLDELIYADASDLTTINKCIGIATTAGVGIGDLYKAVVFVRGFSATGDDTTSIIKSVIFVRGFNSVGNDVITARIALDWTDLPDPGAGGTIINVFRPMFIFDD